MAVMVSGLLVPLLYGLAPSAAEAEGGTRWGREAALDRVMRAEGYEVARSGRGFVVRDSSMSDAGFTTLSGESSVTLAWRPYGPEVRYSIVREGRQVATTAPGAGSFTDTGVRGGGEYEYQVVPLLPPGSRAASVARTWGVRAVTPASGSVRDVRRAAASRARAAAATSTTTVTWVAFIPQKRIDGPLTGCEYNGAKVQYGGDGHGFDWKSNKYRAALNATIDWKKKGVTQNRSVSATHVYVKKTGRLLGTRTASAKQLSARKAGSGKNRVDVRMVLHATNPFCEGLGSIKGAIDGALTMEVGKGGTWAIRSGEHRLMPNHHIYIYNGGKVTDVYKRRYANLTCLVGSATCDLAKLAGRRGTFR
nr:hypothetical protein [Streptomyces sp. SPB074]